ncbi:Scr1 family TA system antitoxin-like transcriptional regulator [Streptomyces sp. NPDC057963]|uniref:DUF5753 domain-containing protein n=1 Tax=Streptomyces sp. NPDC057963 TaxID=3346290 RepID=UPI0036EEF18C
MKRLQLQAMGLYAKTRVLRVYESLFVPGFLQTVDYAKAQFTIHARLHDLPLDDVEETAQNRMVRKRFLGTGAPVFSFLLEASALTNNTGGAEVMNGQLDHLLDVSRLPYVSIEIIPEGRARSLYPGEGFYLFDESLLKQEFWSGAFQTSRPDNISYFVRVFAALRGQAGARCEPGPWPQATVPFTEGALLVLYTDGLIERRNEDIDTGLSRLAAALSADLLPVAGADDDTALVVVPL